MALFQPSFCNILSRTRVQSTTIVLPISTVVALCLFVASCHSDLSKEQRKVRKSAEKCYAMLAEGHYADYVEEIAYVDSMSDSYRGQMIDLVHEHMAALQQKHGEIKQIRAVNDIIQDSLAHVFIQLCFTDSTEEVVGVPMVKIGRKWRMQ